MSITWTYGSPYQKVFSQVTDAPTLTHRVSLHHWVCFSSSSTSVGHPSRRRPSSQNSRHIGFGSSDHFPLVGTLLRSPARATCHVPWAMHATRYGAESRTETCLVLGEKSDSGSWAVARCLTKKSRRTTGDVFRWTDEPVLRNATFSQDCPGQSTEAVGHSQTNRIWNPKN